VKAFGGKGGTCPKQRASGPHPCRRSACRPGGRLQTDLAKGPDANEAPHRLAQFGPNRLPEGKKRGLLLRFLAHLNNILVYVLSRAGFVNLMVGLWLDAAVILAVGEDGLALGY
jgi:magnesium-transporting ATPase (P-type)